MSSIQSDEGWLNMITKSFIQLSSIVITTLVLLAACGNAPEPSADASSLGSAPAADKEKIAKLYFVYGSLTSQGGVKVVHADGSNETLLASGGDIVEPDGI